MRLRTKIGLVAAAIVGALSLAAAAAPYLLDVEQYKPALVKAVKDATGRELVIEGPMKLSMFPQPQISARQVRFANAAGSTGAQMVDVQWIGASPSWPALMRGDFEIGRLTLARPTIVLETDARGRPNWEFTPGASAAQPAGAASTGLHLAIGRLRIVDGTVSYTNPQTGKTLKAEKVDATASVQSFQGPLSVMGSATVNGVPLALEFSLGPPSPAGNDVTFKLKVDSGTLDFIGRTSTFGSDAEIGGKLSVATGQLTDFIAAVLRAAGEPPPLFDAAAVGRFTFDGGVEVSPRKLALNDFRMSAGGEAASGTLVLTPGSVPTLDGSLSLPKVDLEKWLTLLRQPALLAPQASGPAGKAPPAVPALTVNLAVEAAEVVYRKGVIRDVSVGLDLHKGALALSRLRAILPGGMVVVATSAVTGGPARPAARGEFLVIGPRLRETLAWLEIDTAGVPADRLQTFEARGKMVSSAGQMHVSDATFALDGVSGTGAVSVTLGAPPAVSVQIDLKQFDLDAYVPTARATAAEVPSVAPPEVPAGDAAAKTLPAPAFGLKAKVGRLIYRGEPLKGVEADIAVQGNLLKLNALKIADLLGAKGDLRGTVADFGTAPRVDLAFNATMPDTDRLLDYAGLPKFVNGKIGAATASGDVAGTMGKLAVRNLSVSMLGATASVAGAVVLGPDFRFDFARFSLQTADASRLVSVASGTPQSGLGALSATGTFKGDPARVRFEGDLVALGSEMTGTIDTTLAVRPTITATLRVPGTIDFDQWLGVSAAPVPATVSRPRPDTAPPVVAPPLPGGAPRTATAKPIDLAAFRAFDAQLTLFTRSIVVSSLRVNYGDLVATLKGGVVKVSKLTGQFFAGAVDFTGTVDATKDVLALDFAGSLQGIHLGEMLQGAGGTNAFGNDSLTVAIDGKVSIMDIGLRGRGNSPEEIRNSLVGRGRLSGQFYPAVTKGSLSFASFATGVASIFSTEMGFNSAVLAGFINTHNTITGDLTLANGVLVLDKNAVRGQNAQATITSHTNIVSATTDTVILLDVGANGLADYVMTVKGPVASPTLSTRAGPAR
ncbi:MAG: AsmA family protein [Reyranella sp.]|nr:AsmA family protein [Reyranella sp.]